MWHYSFTVATRTSKLLILECDFISTLAKSDPMSLIQSDIGKGIFVWQVSIVVSKGGVLTSYFYFKDLCTHIVII